MIDPGVRFEHELRILHVLRAPDDGVVRNVADLAAEQAARGHNVGILVSETRADGDAERRLAALSASLTLGLRRMPMAGHWRARDLRNIVALATAARREAIDVLHGHGDRGGVYARAAALLLGRGRPAVCYTPRGVPAPGGDRAPRMSLAERVLAPRTDLYLFESLHLANRFHRCVDAGGAVVRIVPPGISPDDLEAVHPDAGAADFLLVGDRAEARDAERLIDAVAILGRRLARPVSLAIVGVGPLEELLTARARDRGIGERVRFFEPRPARHAFALGRILVEPGSRDAVPAIMLEAAGARVPIVATVGGPIGEIFGPYRDRLVPRTNTISLAAAMERAIEVDPGELAAQAGDLAEFVSARFTMRTATDNVIAGYHEALARRAVSSSRHPHIVPIPS